MAQYWLGHRERLRLRAEKDGLEALRPHEILELVLFYAVPRADVAEVARALVGAMGSPQAVFHAPRDALLAVPGVTRAMADWLMLTGEMIDAYSVIEPGDQLRIWRYRDLLGFLSGRWRSVPAPQCWMIYTDYDDRLMTYTVVCDSLHWADSLCTREMIEEALALQARHAFLILFIGAEGLELSQEDRDSLVSLARTLRAIDVELMDCVLVGEQGFYSLSVEGGMELVHRESPLPALHERYCAREEQLDGGFVPDMEADDEEFDGE